MDKYNSLQFLFLDSARFEEFGETDGVPVRNVPFELRSRLIRWTWIDESKFSVFLESPIQEKTGYPTLQQMVRENEIQEMPGIRIVCISDTHNFHNQIDVPDGDILIIAGDVCVHGSIYELVAVNEFLGGLPHKHKLLVAGNHDWCFANIAEHEEARVLLKNATYLQDSGIEIYGINFWGSPWQPEFHDWAFNLPRGRKLAEVWKKIPLDTDVLITHTPPFGILDKNGNGDHCGCEALLNALNRVQPRVHIFGHLHESYGTAEVDGTTYINACICDGQYRPINKPIVIDLKWPA